MPDTTDVLEVATEAEDEKKTEEPQPDSPPEAAEEAKSAPRKRGVAPMRRVAGVLRSARTRRALPIAALLLILGLASTTGYYGWHYRQDRAVDTAAAAALQAANAYAVTLTSVDTTKLDADFQAVLDGSTGEFRDTYTKSSAQLRQLLIDHKATGSGVVLQSAVESAAADEVVVLLFVDQTVTNTEMPDPRIDRSRIVMTMRLVDGHWKAAKVDIP
ncbi:hypothetical protein LTV02_12085 [Nocardia yamanashiensis]|uniref:hypothetical protein n=1 Tax=Nocardia yamanashiensis TaxID=209247 RepID=UPI001E30E775|nr:hypothetical protein [Nocardia yamanashiensis]UGT44072.1 hypothetical protein LTV02_12085 [Nocardia yamanashiensis]